MRKLSQEEAAEHLGPKGTCSVCGQPLERTYCFSDCCMGTEFFEDGHAEACSHYPSQMGQHMGHLSELQHRNDPTYSRPYKTPPQVTMTLSEWEAKRQKTATCYDECCGFVISESYCQTCGVMFYDGHGKFCSSYNKDHIDHAVRRAFS